MKQGGQVYIVLIIEKIKMSKIDYSKFRIQGEWEGKTKDGHDKISLVGPEPLIRLDLLENRLADKHSIKVGNVHAVYGLLNDDRRIFCLELFDHKEGGHSGRRNLINHLVGPGKENQVWAGETGMLHKKKLWNYCIGFPINLDLTLDEKNPFSFPFNVYFNEGENTNHKFWMIGHKMLFKNISKALERHGISELEEITKHGPKIRSGRYEFMEESPKKSGDKLEFIENLIKIRKLIRENGWFEINIFNSKVPTGGIYQRYDESLYKPNKEVRFK